MIEQEARGMERIVVHLGLHIGFRRVEVLRLKVSDIKLGKMKLIGKGRQGGKPRTLTLHPQTLPELDH
jgi:integrase